MITSAPDAIAATQASGLLGPWLAREQPEVDHPAAALTDQLLEHHASNC